MSSHIFNNTNHIKYAAMCFGAKYGTMHIKFQVNQKEIIYCYIRKNASSAFKNLIINHSLFSQHLKKGENPIHFLYRYHRVKSIIEVHRADHIIFVHRDPFDRIISLFKNKFIQKKGATDILNNYKEVMGQVPDSHTFEDFITYLESGFDNIDQHALPQYDHLWPITYTNAIPMNSLLNSLANIIGEENANKYFTKPVNQTSLGRLPDFDFSKTPLLELRRFYQTKKLLPHSSSLLSVCPFSLNSSSSIWLAVS